MEAAICLIYTWSVMLCSLLCPVLCSHGKGKHIWEGSHCGNGAQQMLSTHLICRRLACGSRHAAEP
jgi:hypothetical protein